MVSKLIVINLFFEGKDGLCFVHDLILNGSKSAVWQQ